MNKTLSCGVQKSRDLPLHTHTHTRQVGVPGYSYDIRFCRAWQLAHIPVLHIFILSFVILECQFITIKNRLKLKMGKLEPERSSVTCQLWLSQTWPCPTNSLQPPSFSPPWCPPLSQNSFLFHFFIPLAAVYICEMLQYYNRREDKHTHSHTRFCPAVHPAESRCFSQFTYSSRLFVIPNESQLCIRIFSC